MAVCVCREDTPEGLYDDDDEEGPEPSASDPSFAPSEPSSIPGPARGGPSGGHLQQAPTAAPTQTGAAAGGPHQGHIKVLLRPGGHAAAGVGAHPSSQPTPHHHQMGFPGVGAPPFSQPAQQFQTGLPGVGAHPRLQPAYQQQMGFSGPSAPMASYPGADWRGPSASRTITDGRVGQPMQTASTYGPHGLASRHPVGPSSAVMNGNAGLGMNGSHSQSSTQGLGTAGGTTPLNGSQTGYVPGSRDAEHERYYRAGN